MRALQFWKTVTMDRSNFLDRLLAILEENGIRFCAIGGVGVNAYTYPVVTLDLNIAMALDDVERAEQILGREFKVRRFAHSVNVTAPGSDLFDLNDILRLIEAYPRLKDRVPQEVLEQIPQ